MEKAVGIGDESVSKAFLAARITCFFVPVDRQCALKSICFFYILAEEIVVLFRNTRL